MQFIRIFNVSELKIGDKIAIANSDKYLKELIGGNINLTTGEVTNKTQNSVLVTTDERNLIVTNITTKIQAVYLMVDFLSMNDKSVHNEITLERKLRKSEKLNRRYKAILNKKFNITDEDLDLNFKQKTKTKNRYSQYKIDYKDIPYIENGEIKTLHARLVFKENTKRHIMCEITVVKNDEKLISKGIAVCHRDDVFNKTVGEIIASTKALNDLTCKLY